MTAIQLLTDYFESSLPGYLQILKNMVDINSFTGNPGGVNKLGKLTAHEFSKIGFTSNFIQSTNPAFGKHLILVKKTNLINSPTIGFISHLDTVFTPEEEVKNKFYWRVEGERIYGPGTIDIKGGTVMILMVLSAIKIFFPDTYNTTNWVVLLNAAEERLSPDFSSICSKYLPENIQACLIFEGGTFSKSTYLIPISRKGNATFKIQVEGRSAHSGNNHRQGINAIVQIAHTILTIDSFTDYSKDLTFNIGTIRGGSVVNRVPHFAESLVEMRAFSPQVFEPAIKKTLALNGTSQIKNSDGFKCKVSIQMVSKTNPWPINEKTLKLFSIWKQTGGMLGLKIKEEKRGGLSDGNRLWQKYPTLDGLGPIGSNAHCSERSEKEKKDQEFLLKSSLVPKATLNTLSILRVLTSNPDNK